jgi:hypothetical protein
MIDDTEMNHRNACEKQNAAYIEAMRQAGYKTSFMSTSLNDAPSINIEVEWPSYQPLKSDTPETDNDPTIAPATSMEDIVQRVCRAYGLTKAQLLGRSRLRLITMARYEAMYRCHRELGRSTAAVGRYLGNRDHSTVINGIRRHEERIRADEQRA